MSKDNVYLHPSFKKTIFESKCLIFFQNNKRKVIFGFKVNPAKCAVSSFPVNDYQIWWYLTKYHYSKYADLENFTRFIWKNPDPKASKYCVRIHHSSACQMHLEDQRNLWTRVKEHTWTNHWQSIILDKTLYQICRMLKFYFFRGKMQVFTMLKTGKIHKEYSTGEKRAGLKIFQ